MRAQLKKLAQADLPTKYGLFQIAVYTSVESGIEHTVLSQGRLDSQNVLTRIHSMCLTGDTFSSLKCDCQLQLINAMQMINAVGEGLVIYLNQEGRGVGLVNKIKAYALQDKGLDTVEANEALGHTADTRDYEAAVEILKDLKIGSVRLMTNNPRKVTALKKQGITVSRVPFETNPTEFNRNYLKTKKKKLGHLLDKV